jgi:hypothetical protein
VVSALSLLEEGPRIALPVEPDLFDPNTILQTQDHLSQDYEGLRAVAEVIIVLV